MKKDIARLLFSLCFAVITGVWVAWFKANIFPIPVSPQNIGFLCGVILFGLLWSLDTSSD